jgi:hypothetical protein
VSEITKSFLRDHETLHHELVKHIVSNLRPVRRLWPLRVRLAVWTALQMLILIFFTALAHRPDLAQKIRDPWYVLGVGGFDIAGVMGAYLALRAAVPGRGPHLAQVVLLISLTLVSASFLLHLQFNASLPLGRFIAEGLPCALGIMMFASLPWFALLWAVKRGAPLSPGLDGALIGAGAFLWSFALMRMNCPIDDGLHLFMWHLLPVVVGVALSAGAGVAFLRHRR